MIVACYISNNENIKLNNELNVAKQELLYAQEELLCIQEEADTLNDNLQIESNKNKDLEKTIDNLNLELSIANEKIVNMKNAGVPVYFTEEEVSYIAKTVYGEARGSSKIQQSAVVWCILNRLGDGSWGNTIKSVVTYPSQFHGYSIDYPVTDEIRELVEDVLFRWNMEKAGATNIGRTLPERFLFFHSDRSGFGNIFTTYAGSGERWNFDCWNPYE
jgi:spore germination cell wall hydrolase CwlJ-like protein